MISLDCSIKALESKASWCKHINTWDRICDGTKMDCITKAESLCQAESKCFGFMWNDRMGRQNYGVWKCTSLRLTPKPEQDWEIFLKKCNTGSSSIATFHLGIGSYMLVVDWIKFDFKSYFIQLECANQDGDSTCMREKNKGACSEFEGYMRIYCRKACGFCVGTPFYFHTIMIF